MAQWKIADIPNLTGRVAVVTGANGGLGFESAKALAQHGATVVMACRDAARCAAAACEIEDAGHSGRLECAVLNLADLESVREFAAGFADNHDGLDILVNNGGVMAPPERLTTAQGFELQLGTNHLGHYALTGRLMLQLLQKPGSRVVTVSSFAHEPGRIEFEDLQRERRYTPYGAYSQSKLANLLFMLELDRRLRRAGAAVLSVAAHPGFSSTNLQAAGPFLEGGRRFSAWMVLSSVRAFGQSPRRGAEPQLYAATAAGVSGGDYYGPKNRFRGPVSPSAMAPQARDEDVAARLWDVSRQLTGVDIDAALATAPFATGAR